MTLTNGIGDTPNNTNQIKDQKPLDADNYLANVRDGVDKKNFREISDEIKTYSKEDRIKLKEEIGKDLVEKLTSGEGLKTLEGDWLSYMGKLLPEGYDIVFNEEADKIWSGENVRIFLEDDGGLYLKDNNRKKHIGQEQRSHGGRVKIADIGSWEGEYKNHGGIFLATMKEGRYLSTIAKDLNIAVSNWDEAKARKLKIGAKVEFDTKKGEVRVGKDILGNFKGSEVSDTIGITDENNTVDPAIEKDSSENQDTNINVEPVIKPGIKLDVSKNANISSIEDSNKHNKYSSILSNSANIGNPNKGLIDDELSKIIKDGATISDGLDELNFVDTTGANSEFASTNINSDVNDNEGGVDNNDSVSTLDNVINNSDAATGETVDNEEKNEDSSSSVKEDESKVVTTKKENGLLKAGKKIFWDWSLKHIVNFPKNLWIVSKWSWGKLFGGNKKEATKEATNPVIEQTPVVQSSESIVEKPTVDKTKDLSGSGEGNNEQNDQISTPPTYGESPPIDLIEDDSTNESNGKAPTYTGNDNKAANPNLTTPGKFKAANPNLTTPGKFKAANPNDTTGSGVVTSGLTDDLPYDKGESGDPDIDLLDDYESAVEATFTPADPNKTTGVN